MCVQGSRRFTLADCSPVLVRQTVLRRTCTFAHTLASGKCANTVTIACRSFRFADRLFAAQYTFAPYSNMSRYTGLWSSVLLVHTKSSFSGWSKRSTRGYHSDYGDRSRQWEDSKPSDSTKDNEGAAEVVTEAEVEVVESREVAHLSSIPPFSGRWCVRIQSRLTSCLSFSVLLSHVAKILFFALHSGRTLATCPSRNPLSVSRAMEFSNRLDDFDVSSSRSSEMMKISGGTHSELPSWSEASTYL